MTVVGGPTLIRQLLLAGLRLLDHPELARLRVQKLSVQEIGPRTSLRFRVR